MHTIAIGSSGHLGLYRLETQVTGGSGSLKTSGLGSNASAREAIKVGFDYFKANANRVSASIKPGDHDYHLHVVELHNSGPATAMTLAAFVALCSGALSKPLQQQMVVLGSMSLGGSIVPVENLVDKIRRKSPRAHQSSQELVGGQKGSKCQFYPLAETLQVAFDAGAKRILLPMASVKDIPTIPAVRRPAY